MFIHQQLTKVHSYNKNICCKYQQRCSYHIMPIIPCINTLAQEPLRGFVQTAQMSILTQEYTDLILEDGIPSSWFWGSMFIPFTWTTFQENFEAFSSTCIQMWSDVWRYKVKAKYHPSYGGTTLLLLADIHVTAKQYILSNFLANEYC